MKRNKNTLNKKTIHNRNFKKQRNRSFNYIAFLIFTLSMVIVLSFSFFTIGTKAKEEQDVVTYKYYRQIEVQYGDTLLSIAKRNCTEEYKDYEAYIKEVREINSFYHRNVTPGSFLIVPYYDHVIK